MVKILNGNFYKKKSVFNANEIVLFNF